MSWVQAAGGGRWGAVRQADVSDKQVDRRTRTGEETHSPGAVGELGTARGELRGTLLREDWDGQRQGDWQRSRDSRGERLAPSQAESGRSAGVGGGGGRCAARSAAHLRRLRGAAGRSAGQALSALGDFRGTGTDLSAVRRWERVALA